MCYDSSHWLIFSSLTGAHIFMLIFDMWENQEVIANTIDSDHINLLDKLNRDKLFFKWVCSASIVSASFVNLSLWVWLCLCRDQCALLFTMFESISIVHFKSKSWITLIIKLKGFLQNCTKWWYCVNFFVIGQFWSIYFVSQIGLLEVRLTVSFFVMDKSLVRCWYLLTSLQRRLL